SNFFLLVFYFFQAEDGIRDFHVTGVQTCALPISSGSKPMTHLPLISVCGTPSCPVVLINFCIAIGSFSILTSLKGILFCFKKSRSEERRVGIECRHEMSTQNRNTTAWIDMNVFAE